MPSLAGMPGHRSRRLIDTSDLVFTDPFLMMAEDWMPHGGSGETPCRLLLFSGPPLREPVVFGGPFVMNTEEEIQQAFRDFANRRF